LETQQEGYWFKKKAKGGTYGPKSWEEKWRALLGGVPVAHACNPSYSGDRD
jgi:hypothetical protein